MFKAIKEFFTGKPAVVEASAPVAEYKVEAPLVQLGPEPTAVAEVAVEVAPAKKKPAPKKQQYAKKVPAAIKAPAAKKPRAPKAPK